MLNLCEEFWCQKLLKSDNYSSTYSQSYEWMFFSETRCIYDGNRLHVVTRPVVNMQSVVCVCVGSGPVPVLVMSLLFIASVFMLHIWGKYTRA